MKKHLLSIFLIVVLLAGCGPIIGAGMVAGGGVKELQTVKGELNQLTPGKQLLVLGPLAKTERAYYICRGDEAAELTTQFNDTGLFKADLYMGDRYADNAQRFQALRQNTPEQIKAELGLTSAPDILLTGVILHRSTVAAPAQGVLMDVGYRLKFYDLQTQQEVVIEASIKDLFQDCIPGLVAELLDRISVSGS